MTSRLSSTPLSGSAERTLAPVEHRARWVLSGLLAQAGGTAIPLAIGYRRGASEGLSGHITLATVRLVWHQMIKDHHDLVWIAVGVVLFVVGSVLLARPFCRRKRIWLIAVPVAALAGVVVLGAVALIVAILCASIGDLDLFDVDWPGGSRRRKRRREAELS
jgi:hypothetical protein